MTSSNGSIFRVTGHLCGEFTGPGEFPAQRPVTRSFDVFFDLRLNKRLRKQSWGWWFETPLWSLWPHCNEKHEKRRERCAFSSGWTLTVIMYCYHVLCCAVSFSVRKWYVTWCIVSSNGAIYRWFMAKRRNSIANALDLRLSCTNRSILCSYGSFRSCCVVWVLYIMQCFSVLCHDMSYVSSVSLAQYRICHGGAFGQVYMNEDSTIQPPVDDDQWSMTDLATCHSVYEVKWPVWPSGVMCQTHTLTQT